MLAPIEVAVIFQTEPKASLTRTWEAIVRDGDHIHTITLTATADTHRLTAGCCDCGWERPKTPCVHFRAVEAVEIIATTEPVRN